ncbi:MAG: hypothetical protein ACI83O_000352 [Patescibacteria group bacterium]|jgi:hypothetical protein
MEPNPNGSVGLACTAIACVTLPLVASLLGGSYEGYTSSRGIESDISRTFLPLLAASVTGGSAAGILTSESLGREPDYLANTSINGTIGLVSSPVLYGLGYVVGYLGNEMGHIL